MGPWIVVPPKMTMISEPSFNDNIFAVWALRPGGISPVAVIVRHSTDKSGAWFEQIYLNIYIYIIEWMNEWI